MVQPVVSICIPTYGRVDVLHKTLNSIFFQNIEPCLYEVCISDNSPTDETKEMIESCFSDKSNVVYAKSTCKGYYNSIEALKLGNGRCLKLHNNYSKFQNEMFGRFINRVSEYEEKKPVLFFSSGAIKNKTDYVKLLSFDTFLNKISYFSTWSTSFCIWKTDFDTIMEHDIILDEMFPHTSLLFSLCNKSEYVIDNFAYFENQDVGKKGGYNLPEVFGTRFLGMCNVLLLENKISEQTFQKVKSGILQFIADWYVNVAYFGNKYTFSFENWEKIISDLYGDGGVDFIKEYARKKRVKCLIRKMLRKY